MQMMLVTQLVAVPGSQARFFLAHAVIIQDVVVELTLDSQLGGQRLLLELLGCQ
jgi:hypothetical protein